MVLLHGGRVLWVARPPRLPMLTLACPSSSAHIHQRAMDGRPLTLTLTPTLALTLTRYEDGPRSFYTVYAQLFAALDAEERAATPGPYISRISPVYLPISPYISL